MNMKMWNFSIVTDKERRSSMQLLGAPVFWCYSLCVDVLAHSNFMLNALSVTDEVSSWLASTRDYVSAFQRS